MKHFLIALLLVVCAPLAQAQVSPIPFLKPHWTNRSGFPCSGCLLNTYIAGTTTPQQTFSDALGINANTNPVVLDANGEAFVFLLANSYKLVLTTPGGVTMWSIDNVTSSNLSLLASNNTWTGTNTFQAATVFNGPVQFNVGFTSLGPNVLGGGGSMAGTFSGSPIFSGTPNFSNGFLATTGAFSGQITSTLTTGTAPFVIASTTQVMNLDASLLESCSWEIPCPIGTTTPSTAKFTTMNATTSATINGVTISGTPLANQVLTATSPTIATWVTSAFQSIQSFQQTVLGGDVAVAATTITTVMTRAVTMPVAGCPCRAFLSYSTWITTGTSGVGYALWISDGSTVMAPTNTAQSNGTGGAATSANYAGFSPVTYANGANVTFTLSTEGDHTYTVKAAPINGSGPNSSLQVSIMTSN